MGIADRFKAHKEAREEAFRNPGGPDSAQKIEEISKEDPYGLREENQDES